MKMIKLAIAASLAVASGSALAATTPLESNVLYMGGATATDRTIFESIVDSTNGICETGLIAGQPGTVVGDFDPAVIPHIYTFGATFSPTSPANYLVQCRVRTGLALAGTDIGFGKYSGGSETGVDPVALNQSFIETTNINFPDPTSATCSAGTFVPAAAAPADRIAYIVFTGCAPIARVPQAGVSDVDPALFGASSAVRSAIANDGAVSAAFPPVVTQNFYEALQAAQGIVCAGGTGFAAQTEACMPNLTSAQVRALFSRRITQVSRFFDGNTAFTAPAGGDQIRFCRRGNTSGTQRSFERLYFNQGCLASVPSVLMGSDPSINVGADNCNAVGCTPYAAAAIGAAGIFAGRGSGDVETCLDNANDSGIYGVGLLSSDRVPNDTTKQFRYVKVDGVAPSVERILTQEFGYITETVFIRPTGANPNLANFNLGNRASIYNNLILNRVRVPANIVKTHSQLGFGRGGLVVRPATATAPLTTDTASVRPVAPFMRAATRINSPVNNCNELTVPQNDPIKN